MKKVASGSQFNSKVIKLGAFNKLNNSSLNWFKLFQRQLRALNQDLVKIFTRRLRFTTQLILLSQIWLFGVDIDQLRDSSNKTTRHAPGQDKFLGASFTPLVTFTLKGQ
ncbi:hypothetical protein CEXT_517191 [Caerostris extrusa]|uniref:Uncharacterized protein n=1 Tax=Caerostris extrusa TaxID=172846 RepID=A0AAV4N3T6_CAEEX|nr:hypothetical protein CEXT_517191 [Caerostris extrusa]